MDSAGSTPSPGRRLRFLLLDRPGPRRDGRQLQLELDGYDVITAADLDAFREVLGEVDVAEVVLAEDGDVGRLRDLLASASFATPLLLKPVETGQELLPDSLQLRPQDHVVSRRTGVE